MKIWSVVLVVALAVVLSTYAVADAAKLVKIDEIKIEADKNVSPMDYSFGAKSFSGRLEFGPLKNLYGNPRLKMLDKEILHITHQISLEYYF